MYPFLAMSLDRVYNIYILSGMLFEYCYIFMTVVTIIMEKSYMGH